jgi:hypothetical protein
MIKNSITRHWKENKKEFTESGITIPEARTVNIKTPHGWTRLPGEKKRTIMTYKTVPKFFKHKGRKLGEIEQQLEIT